MTMPTKRQFYRLLCGVAGGLLGFLVHALIMLHGLRQDPPRIVSDQTFFATRVAFIAVFALLTWRASARWWQVLYVEKRYGTPRW